MQKIKGLEMFKLQMKTRVTLLAAMMTICGVSNAQVTMPITYDGKAYYIQAVYGNYDTYVTQLTSTPWYTAPYDAELFTFSAGLVPGDNSWDPDFNRYYTINNSNK